MFYGSDYQKFSLVKSLIKELPPLPDQEAGLSDKTNLGCYG